MCHHCLMILILCLNLNSYISHEIPFSVVIAFNIITIWGDHAKRFMTILSSNQRNTKHFRQFEFLLFDYIYITVRVFWVQILTN